MMHKFIHILMFLFSLNLYGQEPSHYIVGKDIFDGVQLYSVVQDNDGNMWITSNNGLYHYDGIKFSKKSLPKESKRNSLFGLIKDTNGILYCFNQNGQIFRIKNNEISLFYTLPAEYPRGINSILADNKNNLLIKIKSNIILIISPTKQLLQKYSNSSLLTLMKDGDFSYYSLMDLKRRGWVNIIRRYDGKDSVVQYFPDGGSAIMFPMKNNFYLYDRDRRELSFLSEDKKKIIPLDFLKKDQFTVSKINEDFWFSSYKKGTYQISNLDTLTDREIKIEKWFEDYFISGLTKDTENSTWLLTFDKGIIIIPDLNNKSVRPSNNKKIASISKANDNIFVACEDGYIYRYSKNKFEPYFKTATDDRLDFFKVFPEKNCIVTSLYIYHNQKKRAISYARDALLVEDSLLVGVSRGLSSFDLSKKEKVSGLADDRVYQMYCDKKNQAIWLTTTPGLRKYKNDSLISIKHKNRELLGKNVIGVGNEVWVTSKEGIYILRGDSVQSMLTIEEGLLDNEVQNMRYEYPYVYLSHKKGIQRYHIHKKTFQNFGLTKNTMGFEVLNDTIYSVNSDGLFVFTFNKLDSVSPIYTTRIPQALANDVKKIADKAVLEATENNIEFSFITSTFKHQKELTYEYQLLGYEKKPTVAKTNQHYVKYPNLPAGNYTFVVNSYLNNQPNKPAKLTFTIRSYWYDTLWFKLIVTLLILAILYYIYKVRINSVLRKKDKERMQKQLAESSLTSLKAQMNPHFLFNAMNSIQALIIDDRKRDAYQYLTQLSNLVRENLQMSNVTFVPFESELKLIEKYLELEQLRFKDTLSYKITNHVQNEHVFIPSMIIQPFVENAIKHGLLHRMEDRQLSVAFTELPNMIVCVVTDNGIGREASKELRERKHTVSFSTNAIQKRFDILKEYYQMNIGFTYDDLYENNEASGTKVTIRIPYKTDDFEE